MAIAIYNLSDKEMKDNKRINTITRTVTKVIREALNVPGTGLKEEDLSPFTFHKNSLRESGKVSVVITEASFSRRKVDVQARLILCWQMIGALASVLQRKVDDISVEVKRPE